jgi:hypothetical protein
MRTYLDRKYITFMAENPPDLIEKNFLQIVYTSIAAKGALV